MIIASTIRFARIVRINADGSGAAQFFYEAPAVTVSAEAVRRLGLVEGSLCEFGPSSRSPRPADTRLAERPERKAAA
jgi:hypothetical protein